MTKNIAVIRGDGIGPEIVEQKLELAITQTRKQNYTNNSEEINFVKSRKYIT